MVKEFEVSGKVSSVTAPPGLELSEQTGCAPLRENQTQRSARWRAEYEKYVASGQSVNMYSREQGLVANTLLYWIKKFRSSAA